MLFDFCALVFFAAGFLVVVFFAVDAFLVAAVDLLDLLVAKVHRGTRAPQCTGGHRETGVREPGRFVVLYPSAAMVGVVLGNWSR